MAGGFFDMLQIQGVMLSALFVPAAPASRTLQVGAVGSLDVKANDGLIVSANNALKVK